MTQKTINIASIRVNGGTQSRASINRDTVSDYAEAMGNGATFPPIVVFYDGADYWLADGFHRYEAYDRASIYDVPAEVHQGTQRDAILYSLGANDTHGMRRSAEDKRRSIQKMFSDPEWSTWSDREIARQCRVSPSFVAKYRPELSVHVDRCERTVQRGGTTYTQDVSNIGAKSKADDKPNDELPSSPEPVSYAPTEEPDLEPVDPVEAKLRKEFLSLTNEAREDAYVGLSLDLRDAKAKAKDLAAENKALKEQLKGFEGDQADTIRRLQATINHKQSEMFRANDKADKALARAKHLERRVKELESMGIAV